MSRFDQCTETCTTDCGHCKGRPVMAMRAEISRLREGNANLIRNAEILADELIHAMAERDAAIRVVDVHRWPLLDVYLKLARQRPVIEAAKAWRNDGSDPSVIALIVALDALDTP